MRKMTWAAAAVVVLIGIAGFTRFGPLSARAAEENRAKAGEPQVGAACRVILRGDAVGYSFEDKVVDLDSLISKKGTFIGSDAGWVTIRDGGKDLWIPRGSIMMIEVTR